MDSEAFYCDLLLIRACRTGAPATIDDVHFDLAHPDLDRTIWEPTTSLGSHSQADIHAPRLLLPWSSSVDAVLFEKRGDGVQVRGGDSVFIESVQKMSVRADHGELDHPQHKERRWARLLVVRPRGARVAVLQGWEFQGIADVMTSVHRRDYRQARHALLARLSAALGLESIDDLLLADSRAAWPEFAESAKPLDRLAAEVLWAAEGEYVEEAAMVFGYLMGRAEAGDILLPLAERQIEARDHLREIARQPRKSGDRTRDAALDVLSENPKFTRRKCAEKVATMRGLNDIKNIERTIGAFFRRDPDGRHRATPEALATARRKKPVGGLQS